MEKQERLIWLSTGLTDHKTITGLIKEYGLEGFGALIHLWEFARKADQSGKLDDNFVEAFEKDFKGLSRKDCKLLLDNGWLDWLVKHNLLEETTDGYQIVFGLVYFDEPEQD
jgi:hypothetical protein